MKLLEMALNVRKEQIKDWQRSRINRDIDQSIQDITLAKRIAFWHSLRNWFTQSNHQVLL